MSKNLMLIAWSVKDIDTYLEDFKELQRNPPKGFVVSLVQLTNSTRFGYRVYLDRDIKLDYKDYSKLSQHSIPFVRSLVPLLDDCPEDIFLNLVKDTDGEVLFRLEHSIGNREKRLSTNYNPDHLLKLVRAKQFSFGECSPLFTV